MTRLELKNLGDLNNDKGKNRYRHDFCCIAGLHISRNTRACRNTEINLANIRTQIQVCKIDYSNEYCKQL